MNEDDEFNVSKYTESELFNILNVNNPTDRELEAKIISMIRKYRNIGNKSGDKLVKFFEDIYDYFFEEEEDDRIEGFTNLQLVNGNLKSNSNVGNLSTVQTQLVQGNVYGNNSTNWANISIPNMTIGAGDGFGNAVSINDKTQSLSKSSEPGVMGQVNVGSKVTPATDNLQLTRPLDYSKDTLNPLLKQTIKRIISIDSQYRDQKSTTPSTNFTFNLSEPLRDVVSLSLYSIQIPYTWYTINSDFGGNFFYLKGHSPGINNGNHDYKISIPAGNYTPSALATAVNTGIQNIIYDNTDVSFGNTQIIYNNGLPSDSGTGKCALQVDIKKVFNQSNYFLSFPNWSSPVTPSERLKTIAGYFGFNNQTYYCSSIYSNFISVFTNDTTQYSINAAAINSFQIVPYIGVSYLVADVSYAPITISLNASNQVQRSTMVNLLNEALSTNPKLDLNPSFTGCNWIDISNSAQYGSGSSYIKMKCKLRNGTSPVIENVKLAAVFPSDQYSIFYGPASIFQFPSTTQDANTGNVICEFNELIAENSILQTNYSASGDQMIFECIPPVYKANSSNNYVVTIPNGTYTLYSYIDAANNAIQKHPSGFYLKGGSITNVSIDSGGYVKIQTSINNSYVNVSYSISTNSQAFQDIFGLSNQATPLLNDASFSNTSNVFSAISISQGDSITISPNPNFGNSNADPFEIVFGAFTSDNGSEIATYLQTVISNYVDPVTNLKPCSGTAVEYDSVSSTFILIVNVNLNLTQTSYKLSLLSNSTQNVFWNVLGFDSPYVLTNDANNQCIISSPNPMSGFELTIYEGSNNQFTISADSSVDGLQTSNNLYNVIASIPDTNANKLGTKYSIQSLINVVNSQFAQNEIMAGTHIDVITNKINGKNYIRFIFNINKVFSTKDYQLVFYDPYSFAKCQRAGSGSSQNATWDTTLGWILGYRNEIYYNMSDYVGTYYVSTGTSPPNIFYFTDKPNVFVIYGDTSVSTNLYNYFLIMLDDYVQNHLNDGLVTITSQETSNDPGPHIYICDPTNGNKIAVPADYASRVPPYTQKQLQSFNEKVISQNAKVNSYSSGPFVQDIFGIIPVKTAGMPIGSVYVEFGGTLQLQQRLYFGPVNIHRMTIKLLNDRGNMVDLNGANWSFSLICEQLYKS